MQQDGRKIYLVRHGEVFNNGVPHICLGRTDVPMSVRGEQQIHKVARCFTDKKISRIYSSPLKRCIQTAKIIRRELQMTGQYIEIHVEDDLSEMDAGKWENISFEEIRKKYPKEYEDRGKNLGTYAFPGGESFAQAGERFRRCMEEILKETAGDILIVAHAGVIRGYLAGILGISMDHVMEIPQPYAGITILQENRGNILAEKSGWKPSDFLDEEEILALYRRCKTQPQVIRHMEAVAGYLEYLHMKLNIPYCNWDRLKKAALVHDICRTEKHHSEKGARILRNEGYEEIAALVEAHHNAENCIKQQKSKLPVSEAELLYYADKRVKDDQIVTIKERFAESLKKCDTFEAIKNHRIRYQKTEEIEEKIKTLMSEKEDNYETDENRRRCGTGFVS